MTKEFVELAHARELEQREVMKTILAAGHCPFCWENLSRYHKKPILQKSTHWILTENQWPYKHTRIHLIAIYKKHTEKLMGVDLSAWEELGRLMQWAEQEFDMASGGLVIRFGNTAYNGGTVNHLHAQLIAPDLDDPNFKPIRFRVGTKPPP